MKLCKTVFRVHFECMDVNAIHEFGIFFLCSHCFITVVVGYSAQIVCCVILSDEISAIHFDSFILK